MTDILTVIYKIDSSQQNHQKTELSRLQSIGSVESSDSTDSGVAETDSENNLKSKAEMKETVIIWKYTGIRGIMG